MPAKPDILELYGMSPKDPRVADRLLTRICPFTKNRCSRVERGSSTPTGVCTVSLGATKTPVIICEERLHGDWFATLRLAASETFGAPRFITGGSKLDMANRLAEATSPAVVAFRDVEVMAKSKITLGWVLQHYDYNHKRGGFVAAETLGIDITGSYRSCLEGYRDLHGGREGVIPASQHSINWSTLQKKIMPEIIRKGLILASSRDCCGNYLIIPDAMLQKMDTIFADVPERAQIAPHILSIRAYAPDKDTESGVRVTRAMNLGIRDIATAFYARVDDRAAAKLDSVLKSLL